jgi:hypothetical protein
VWISTKVPETKGRSLEEVERIFETAAPLD